jgi:pimeloyl-ACP methyl ester carboxylesterase
VTGSVLEVPVAGGRLAVEVHDGQTAPVLAVHGISSHRRLWDWLLAHDPGLSLVAPDLRGRGDSLDVAGFGLPRHADDLIAVLDDLGLGSVTVCGMSMGGFVAVDMALRYPDRVRSLVLVDGGFPMATPPGLTKDMIPAMFADRLARLDQKWPSLEEFRDFFVSETAPLLDRDDPILRAYLAHDLDADGRVRLSGEALLADAAGAFFDAPDWRQLGVPARLLHAEFSRGAGTPPAYSAEAVAGFREQLPALVDVQLVPGADHAATIMTPAGAAATAALLKAALGS